MLPLSKHTSKIETDQDLQTIFSFYIYCNKWWPHMACGKNYSYAWVTLTVDLLWAWNYFPPNCMKQTLGMPRQQPIRNWWNSKCYTIVKSPFSESQGRAYNEIGWKQSSASLTEIPLNLFQNGHCANKTQWIMPQGWPTQRCQENDSSRAWYSSLTPTKKDMYTVNTFTAQKDVARM